MPPPLLVDLTAMDLDKIVFDRSEIERVNPQRHEMRQLDRIVYFDPKGGVIVGYKEITLEEFWIPGHIPDRPIMPGVIMIEAAAQLVSFASKKINDYDRFIGFGGIESAKFRGTVPPGCRLYLAGRLIENRPRRVIFDTQGIVDGRMVFEARIIGMPV
ncbi:MAG: beta-hydroxyacyl-ACP dehydratase [Planctomycetes bacterium]|nr:beta-hydroxyacyl-ACP dehydratase [Planctomycetota bacterium]